METHGASQRLACRAVGISRSVHRYQPDKQRNDPVIAALQAVVERYPAYGFRKLFKYCLLNLNQRRRGKRRLQRKNTEPLAVQGMANQCKSMEFMSDSLFCGRRFRTFNIVDDFNREALAIEIDLGQPALRVIRVWYASWHGAAIPGNCAWISFRTPSQ